MSKNRTSSTHKSWGHGGNHRVAAHKTRRPAKRAAYLAHFTVTVKNKIRRLRAQVRKHPNNSAAAERLRVLLDK